MTARRPAKNHKRVYPPPAFPTGQTPPRQANPQQGRLPVSSSNCHAHDAFLLFSGRLAQILDALDGLSFLALGPFSKPRGRKWHRVTVLLLAHGMAWHRAWRGRPPEPASQPASQNPSVWELSTGMPLSAGRLVGHPIYLWPMPGQCLVSPRLARGTQLHTQPALPRLSTYSGAAGQTGEGGWGTTRHPTLGMPWCHPGRSTQTRLDAIHTQSTCGRRGASPT